ncbi:MAG TPA: hypothetical protein DEP53_05315 [Bacteroidetes bacterium]|nr:hypothetical protein [Bacteroidota bacterium]
MMRTATKGMERPEWLKRKTRQLTGLNTTTMIMKAGAVITAWDSATTIHPGGTGMPRSLIPTTMDGRVTDIRTSSTASVGTIMDMVHTVIMVDTTGTLDIIIRTPTTMGTLTSFTEIRARIKSRQETQAIDGRATVV